MTTTIKMFKLGMVLGVGNLICAFAHAEDSDNFAKSKNLTLEMLDKKIDDLKQTKVCVQKAKARPELQACRAEAREGRLELREEIKTRRDELRERRERSRNENKMERKGQNDQKDPMERKE